LAVRGGGRGGARRLALRRGRVTVHVYARRGACAIRVVDVVVEGGWARGRLDRRVCTPDVRELFEAHEEAVNGGAFSVADDLERGIEALAFRVEWDGRDCPCADLQVMAGRVCFRPPRARLLAPR
jgi:hypothetical protein